MSTLSTQGGKLLLRQDKLGTEQACCCSNCAPCPDLEALCIAITLTDYDGTVYTADQDDIAWAGGIGTVYFSGFDYAVTIACDIVALGGISVTAGWSGLIGTCICTSGQGNDSLVCSEAEDWYLGTASGTIEFDDIGLPCDGDCPANLGSFSVTFSDPPC